MAAGSGADPAPAAGPAGGPGPVAPAWRPALAAADLPPGAVVGVEVAGRRLALWRSAAGVVHAVDDRCPHQWSPLSAEGVVEGEELVCAAHCWRFDGDGVGTKVNVHGRRDPKAAVEVVPARLVGEAVEVRC